MVYTIGQETANARVAEQRHRAAHSGDVSPLVDVVYDTLADDLGFDRFVENSTDRAIRKFLSTYRALDQGERAQVRCALRMDDFKALLVFARRCVLAAVQCEHGPSLREGLDALTTIAQDRIDPRDVMMVAAMLSWAMRDTEVDSSVKFDHAACRAEQKVGRILQRFALNPVESLAPWGYRSVNTASGSILVEDRGRPFNTTIDLVEVAREIALVLEKDVYRVSNITVANELPEVWLRGGTERLVRSGLESIRACLTMRGVLSRSDHPKAASQQFTVFLVETASVDGARAIASAAQAGKQLPHEALGLAKGRLCCVLVARSFVIEHQAFEGPGALQRFTSDLSATLTREGRTRDV
jgi:hypothetical protein